MMTAQVPAAGGRRGRFCSFDTTLRAAAGLLAAMAWTLSAGAAADGSAPAEAAPADAEQAPLKLIPVPQPAPDKPKVTATELGGVTVTGSHIKRADSETAQPVLTLSRKDIERTGVTDIGDILQQQTASGAALNTAYNNGGTGAIEIDLRNLGSNRVLVLVDGHRWVSGLRSLSVNSVDLNTIPEAIVDHIDVLLDGASSAYGSDAITGVVNVVTRKRIDGLQFSTHVGAYTQGDGLQQLHTLAYGHSFGDWLGGGTNLMGTFSFEDQNAVWAGNRDISAVPLYNTGLSRGSSFTPEGRSLFIPNQQNSLTLGASDCPSIVASTAQGAAPAPIGSEPLPPALNGLPVGLNLCDITHTGSGQSVPGNYRAYRIPEDNYNYAQQNLLVTPRRTYTGFFGLNHDFNDALSFTLQALYTLRDSRQVLAPQPICVGDLCPVIGGAPQGSEQSYNQLTYISKNNPYNPFGQDIGRPDPSDPTNANPCTVTGPVPPVAGQNPCTPVLGLVGQGAVLRRMVEAGNRAQLQSVPTDFARAAFNGNTRLFNLLPVPLEWELGYSNGRSAQSDLQTNLVRMDHLQASLGEPADCTGDCQPLNLFGGPGTITRPMLDYLLYNDYSATKNKQQDLYANFSTVVPHLLPAGDLGVAFGVERRVDHFSFAPSQESIDGTTSGLTAQPTDGAQTVKEAFVELSLPLLRDLPLARKLELDLGGRLSDYGSFGTPKDGKIGLAWKPARDLLLRSTFSNSFRAPNVGELFLGQEASYVPLTDPCAAPASGSNAATNCKTAGVAAYTPTVSQYLSPFGGNPKLRPETSHSLTAGLVFSPEYLPGFDASIGYWQIELDNFITAPGGQFELDNCYNADPSTYSGDSPACQSVHRNNGQLESVSNLFSNFAKVSTKGFDLSFDYAIPAGLPLLDALGKFKLVANASFVSAYDEYLPDGNGGSTKEGLVGTGDSANGNIMLPRWKVNPQLQWTQGNWSGSWTAHIISARKEPCDDGQTPTLVSLGLCSEPNHTNPDGTPGPLNKIKAAAKNDIQVSYRVRRSGTVLSFGVQNVLNQDPPVSYYNNVVNIANSFDPSTYWVPGVLPYFSLVQQFK